MWIKQFINTLFTLYVLWYFNILVGQQFNKYWLWNSLTKIWSAKNYEIIVYRAQISLCIAISMSHK